MRTVRVVAAEILGQPSLQWYRSIDVVAHKGSKVSFLKLPRWKRKAEAGSINYFTIRHFISGIVGNISSTTSVQ